jgi:PhnB protein
MRTVTPYLNFDGTAEQAFTLYRTVFGGEFQALMRWGDAPFADKVPVAERRRIMHISLPLISGAMLAASDSCPGMGKPLTVGNSFSICVETDSVGESDRMFAALSAGGAVEMPLQNTFWGAYYGMCTDRFGVQWMFNHTLAKPPGA